MTSIWIRTRVESETLILPELKPLIGKMVEIRVTEQPEETETSAAQRWRAAAEAVAALTDYDADAWSKQRSFDQEHGGDHLR